MNPEFRIIDANFNRAREALRVMEDYARFVLDDISLSAQAKALRHDLCQTVGLLPARRLLSSRDTPGDVGTTLTTPTETQRENLTHIVTAAAKRLTEALRCLEEYSKIGTPEIAAEMESIRYRAYELEKQLLLRTGPNERLKKVRLYVLLTENLCRRPILEVAEAALKGGADCLQLREKAQSDSELLETAQKIGVLCRQWQALFIINDRVDIALLCGADGVHFGMDDLTVAQGRRIAGPDLIVGKSTHNRQEAQQAIEQGADYIAVGSIFASPTKPQVEQAGLAYIKEVRMMTNRPIIAIGGIDSGNAAQAIHAGADAVAVCQAVIAQENPEKSAKSLKTAVLNV